MAETRTRRARGWPRIVGALAAALALLVVAAIAFVALFDWNRLRDPLARYASERSGYTVRIDGDLDVELLTRRPGVAIAGVRVDNPAWSGAGRRLLELRSAAVEWRWLPLLAGDLVVERLHVVQPDVDLRVRADGRTNWQAGRPTREGRGGGGAPDLPLVRRFVVEDGRLTVDDAKRRLRLSGTVDAAETAGRGGHAFRVEGDGTLNREPFELAMQGGPLVNLDPGEPYVFDTRVAAGETRVRARTRIDEPFDLAKLSTQATLEGRDLAELYFLTGVALPNSRAYRLTVQVRRDGTRIDVPTVEGRIGDSDLGGRAALDLGGERPKLTARLVSRELDLGDLAAPLGVGLRDGAAARSGERLLPDAELQVDRLRGLDADVHFRAERVVARRVPFREVELGAQLAGGVLTLEPLRFSFAPGQLAGNVRIDATGEEPRTRLDLRVTGLDLARVQFGKAADAPGEPAEPPLEGVIRGRLRLEGGGRSVGAFAANAGGGATFVIPDGSVNQAFAQLTGIQVARGLGLLLTDADRQTGLRCGVVDFQLRDGLAEVRTLLFDTEVVRIVGSGKVSLERESFDLEIRGRPKQASLLRLRTPIRVRGTFADPALGVDAGKVAAQGGLAAVLGAVLTPLASVLAFVDPGLAEDANCGALLAEAKSRGAPVGTRTAAAERAEDEADARADRDRNGDGDDKGKGEGEGDGDRDRDGDGRPRS